MSLKLLVSNQIEHTNLCVNVGLSFGGGARGKGVTGEVSVGLSDF